METGFTVVLGEATAALDDLVVAATTGGASDRNMTKHLFAKVREALAKAEAEFDKGELAPRRHRSTIAALSSTSHGSKPTQLQYTPLQKPSPEADLFAKLSPIATLVTRLAQRHNNLLLSPNEANDLKQLRRHNEDVAIAAARVDSAKIVATRSEQRTWLDWSQAGIALQIARVDVALFVAVADVKSCLSSVSSDSSFNGFSNPISLMLQFQRSIAASVVSSILSVRLQPASPSSSGHTPTPSELANLKLRAMARMIESIVGVVFLLFYIYRDLNGTFAILQGLSDPRLARLSKLWDLVAVKCKDALANLNDVVGVGTPNQPLVTASASEDIALVVELLQHHFRGSDCVTVVPNFVPFIQELNHLKTEYTIDDTFASPTNLPILSDIGTQALDELINVLLLCQGRNTGNPDSILDIPPPLPNNPPPHANPPSSTFTPLHLAFDMSELAIGAASATQQFYGAPDMGASQPAPWDVPPASPILDDLAGLPQGDLRCLHWVLTRGAFAATVNERDLWALSFEITSQDKDEVGYVESPPPPPVVEIDPSRAPKFAARVELAAEKDGDGWSDREEEVEEDTGRKSGKINIQIAPGIVAAALVAAAGNATPIAGLAQQVSEEDEALRELENDAWSVAGVGTGELGDDRDPALDEEEYQTRFKALEALFPKSPSGKPMND